MRDVVLYSLVSLDGVAEAPDTFVLDWDDEVDDHLAAVIAEQDAVLLGRRTYDEWSGYWPSSEIQPFAAFINAVDKYVFTSTALSDGWSNSHVVREPAATAVADLKRSDGGTIGIHGSLTLARSLLAAELVDELRLVVAPVSVGAGRRLFDETGLHRWTLVSGSATPSGTVLQRYRLGGRTP